MTPHLLDSKLQPVGTFTMYSIFATIGFIHHYYRVPETKGRSEKEKKELFMPGGAYGRKLEEGEVWVPSTTNSIARVTDSQIDFSPSESTKALGVDILP